MYIQIYFSLLGVREVRVVKVIFFFKIFCP